MCSICLGLSKSNRLQRELCKNDFEDHHCVSASKTKTSMTRLSTSKLYGDHDLHHEWQWLAAMTPHRFSQLLTVGVDKHITICLKFQANNHKKSCISSLCNICGSNVEDSLGHDLIISLYNSLYFLTYRMYNTEIIKSNFSASRQEMNKVPSLEGKFVIRVFF